MSPVPSTVVVPSESARGSVGFPPAVRGAVQRKASSMAERTGSSVPRDVCRWKRQYGEWGGWLQNEESLGNVKAWECVSGLLLSENTHLLHNPELLAVWCVAAVVHVHLQVWLDADVSLRFSHTLTRHNL